MNKTTNMTFDFRKADSYAEIRQLRVEEYTDTISIVNQGFYLTEDGTKVIIDGSDQMARDTRFYSKEFAGKYRLIVFAILEDSNSHRSHNREGNYKPFAEEFA